jgi:hypothetical protein
VNWDSGNCKPTNPCEKPIWVGLDDFALFATRQAQTGTRERLLLKHQNLDTSRCDARSHPKKHCSEWETL